MAYDSNQLQTYKTLLDANAGEIANFSNYEILVWSNTPTIAYREQLSIAEFLERGLESGVWQSILSADNSGVVSAKIFKTLIDSVKGVVESFDIDKTAIKNRFDALKNDSVITEAQYNAIYALVDTYISIVQNAGLPPAEIIDVRRAKQL